MTAHASWLTAAVLLTVAGFGCGVRYGRDTVAPTTICRAHGYPDGGALALDTGVVSCRVPATESWVQLSHHLPPRWTGARQP